MSTQFAFGPVAWRNPRVTSDAGTQHEPEAPVFTRFVAVVAVAMAAGHLWVMAAFPHGALMDVLLALMVLSCLKCAHRAWKRSTALVELLAMSALMAITHTFMALGIQGHQHGGDPVATTVTSGAVVMLAVAAAELILALLCGIGLRRVNSRPATPRSRG